MSALSMSKAEREGFLAGLHVGVVAVAEAYLEVGVLLDLADQKAAEFTDSDQVVEGRNSNRQKEQEGKSRKSKKLEDLFHGQKQGKLFGPLRALGAKSGVALALMLKKIRYARKSQICNLL